MVIEFDIRKPVSNDLKRPDIIMPNRRIILTYADSKNKFSFSKKSDSV